MIKKITFAVIPLFLSSTAIASDYLGADEVKALFTNKTFDVHNVVKDKKVQGYDNDQGEHLIYIPWKDKISERKWWLEENKHCTSNKKRGDSCKLIKVAGDGVYHGITDGKHTHTLSNFRDGESFNK